MNSYDHRQIDRKWQSRWAAENTFATPKDRKKPKYYVLDMFPYPTGVGLHVGHPKGYVASDVVARVKRMMGFNVLHTMGWDAFGLPTERQAAREGRHPREVTERNIATFKSQLQRLGLSYDWSREFSTTDPSYYRWTQWIFLQLYQRGLAYRAEVPVNFCPALGTVLANEEVKDGVYVDTGDPVEKRLMKQWILRITQYADPLLAGLESVEWPEGIKQQQKQWIGRSDGADIAFKVDGSGIELTAFTTRPDTIFGCTFLAIAPEHPALEQLTKPDCHANVADFIRQVNRRTERERIAQGGANETSGVFTGSYALNPVNGAKVPIWVADYVLGSHGSGAVFGCPAHDERDFAFAKSFQLPVIEVVQGGDVSQEAYAGDGPHVRSDFLNGLFIEDAKRACIDWLEKNRGGRAVTRYRLRDWLFSRQRYWGEPIPVVELEDGTIRPVPEADLPVVLPDLKTYSVTEEFQAPLAAATDWVTTRDPVTGEPARREVNTMPQWAGSCWYYLRFVSPNCETAAWDKDEERYWMPVDLYIGGAEHATLHLLYSRFWHRVLFDLGKVSTPEPFARLFNQGLTTAPSFRDARGRYYHRDEVESADGRWVVKSTREPVETRLEKMSKSKSNVVNPDDMCEAFGADALRVYEMFMGPLEEGSEWDGAGIIGSRRFLDRVYRLMVDPETGALSSRIVDDEDDNPEVERKLHAAIKKVTDSVDTLRFNSAVAELMGLTNAFHALSAIPRAWVEAFVLILSPFAPHLCEELWEALGHRDGLAYAYWPQYSAAKLESDTVTVAVQVNGKLRAAIELPTETERDAAVAAARANPKVAAHLKSKRVIREIYVPKRLINFVLES